MSKCRASTFYLAPGVYRSFDSYAVFTKVADTWVEITHRKDVERLDRDGTWDGECFVVSKHELGGDTIEAAIHLNPDRVERWKLCARTINGRRSDGVDHMLHKVARNGAVNTGGVRECVGQVLGAGPAGKRCVRWFESNPELQPSAQAFALKFLQHANTRLDDGELQSLISAMERTPCVVPMPLFANGPVVDVEFLQRWPSATRVKLLADLWRTTVLHETEDYLRVAEELLDHSHPPVRESAQQALRRVTELSGSTVLAVVKDNNDFSLSNLPLSDDMVATLAATSATRHLVALHPSNRSGDLLGSIAADGTMERRRLEVPAPDQHVDDSILDEIVDILNSKDPAHLKHTHSTDKAENLLKLAVVLAHRRPEHGAQVAAAFATWTRCRGTHTEGASWSVARTFAQYDLELDRDSIDRLWKSSHELAVRGQQRTAARNPGAQQPLQSYAMVELASMVEHQPDTPDAIRERAFQWCHDSGLRHRDLNGRLCNDRDHIWRCVTGGDVGALEAFIGEAPTPDQRERAAGAVLRDAALRGVDDAMWAKLCSVQHGFAVAVAETGFRERTRTAQAASARETLNAARGVVRGTISAEELERRVDDLNAVRMRYVVGTYIQNFTPHTRKWLLDDYVDADIIVKEHVMSGHAAVVSSPYLHEAEQQLQTLSALHARTDVDWPVKPKRFSDLPTVDAVAWHLPEPVEHLQGCQLVADDTPFNVRVIDSFGELKENAAPNAMGNCTDGYARAIRSGESLIIALQEHGRTVINVNLEARTTPQGRQVWDVEEIKGRRNADLGADMNDAVATAVLGLLPRRLRGSAAY